MLNDEEALTGAMSRFTAEGSTIVFYLRPGIFDLQGHRSGLPTGLLVTETMNVTLIGTGPISNRTTLSAGWRHSVITVRRGGALSLRNLDVTEGRCTLGACQYGKGAGCIWVGERALLNLDTVRIRGCLVDVSGQRQAANGALALRPQATLNARNVLISNVTTVAQSGHSFASGIGAFNATVSMHNSKIVNATTYSAMGSASAALFLRSGQADLSRFVIANAVTSSHLMTKGGAIYHQQGALRMRNSLFRNNRVLTSRDSGGHAAGGDIMGVEGELQLIDVVFDPEESIFEQRMFALSGSRFEDPLDDPLAVRIGHRNGLFATISERSITRPWEDTVGLLLPVTADGFPLQIDVAAGSDHMAQRATLAELSANDEGLFPLLLLGPWMLVLVLLTYVFRLQILRAYAFMRSSARMADGLLVALGVGPPAVHAVRSGLQSRWNRASDAGTVWDSLAALTDRSSPMHGRALIRLCSGAMGHAATFAIIVGCLCVVYNQLDVQERRSRHITRGRRRQKRARQSEQQSAGNGAPRAPLATPTATRFHDSLFSIGVVNIIFMTFEAVDLPQSLQSAPAEWACMHMLVAAVGVVRSTLVCLACAISSRMEPSRAYRLACYWWPLAFQLNPSGAPFAICWSSVEQWGCSPCADSHLQAFEQAKHLGQWNAALACFPIGVVHGFFSPESLHLVLALPAYTIAAGARSHGVQIITMRTTLFILGYFLSCQLTGHPPLKFLSSSVAPVANAKLAHEEAVEARAAREASALRVVEGLKEAEAATRAAEEAEAATREAEADAVRGAKEAAATVRAVETAPELREAVPPQPRTDRGRRTARQGLCVICMDGQATHLLISCGHMSFCKSCASRLLTGQNPRCPICQTPSTSSVEVFQATVEDSSSEDEAT